MYGRMAKKEKEKKRKKNLDKSSCWFIFSFSLGCLLQGPSKTQGAVGGGSLENAQGRLIEDSLTYKQLKNPN